MRIGLLGSTGKMGTAVLSIVDNVVCHRRGEDKAKVFIESEVVIDFSVSEEAHSNVYMAQFHKKPLLLCTTGHENLDYMKVTVAPIAYAPNTCIEWMLLHKAIQAIHDINSDLQVTLDDIHTKTKRDAPSGTAKDLVQNLGDVQIRSIRGPNVSSWHKISLFGEDQVIHIEHQVLNRRIYAVGAISLAILLTKKQAGFYSVQDLFEKN